MSTGNPDMMDALKLLAAEKGISVDVLLQALADALASAYKRMPGAADEAEVEIDVVSGDIKVMAYDIDEEGNWVNPRDDTPADAPASKPKRIIQGDKTDIQFNNGVYVDPKNGDIYSVESDTGDRLLVFSTREAADHVRTFFSSAG